MAKEKNTLKERFKDNGKYIEIMEFFNNLFNKRLLKQDKEIGLTDCFDAIKAICSLEDSEAFNDFKEYISKINTYTFINDFGDYILYKNKETESVNEQDIVSKIVGLNAMMGYIITDLNFLSDYYESKKETYETTTKENLKACIIHDIICSSRKIIHDIKELKDYIDNSNILFIDEIDMYIYDKSLNKKYNIIPNLGSVIIEIINCFNKENLNSKLVLTRFLMLKMIRTINNAQFKINKSLEEDDGHEYTATTEKIIKLFNLKIEPVKKPSKLTWSVDLDKDLRSEEKIRKILEEFNGAKEK